MTHMAYYNRTEAFAKHKPIITINKNIKKNHVFDNFENLKKLKISDRLRQ